MQYNICPYFNFTYRNNNTIANYRYDTAAEALACYEPVRTVFISYKV